MEEKLVQLLLSLSTNLFLIVLCAGIVEAITEFLFAPLFDKIKWLSENKWLLPYVPVPLGILIAYWYGFDIIFEISQKVNGGLVVTPLGITLTGILMGRGSNFLHQYTERWFPAKRG